MHEEPGPVLWVRMVSQNHSPRLNKPFYVVYLSVILKLFRMPRY